MVDRVSTIGNYSAILANLMSAQQQQTDAGNRVATQKNGTDLKAYAKNAEMLTAMRSVQTRLDGYQDQNLVVADKLSTQDTAINQVATAATNTRQAIADALASGRADTLMSDLQANMRDAVGGMNTRYGGKYLFSGGQIDTSPVSAGSLSDLTSGPAISSFFHNDQFKAQSKVDDSTTVTTGMLASDIGTDMLTSFKALQSFSESSDGPLTGELTDAQRSFLEGQLASWDSIGKTLNTMAGANGLVQDRVDSVKTDLTARSTNLSAMMSNITDADMGKAVTDLQTAQMSVQAAAQVFNVLQQSSLLNFLSNT